MVKVSEIRSYGRRVMLYKAAGAAGLLTRVAAPVFRAISSGSIRRRNILGRIFSSAKSRPVIEPKPAVPELEGLDGFDLRYIFGMH